MAIRPTNKGISPMSSVAVSLHQKLNLIAGDGRAKHREAKVRSTLNWRDKAKSAVRHMLAGEQVPSLDEAAAIEAAYDKIERERHELFKVMQAGLRAMENSKDAEFYSAHIDALRRYLLPRGEVAGGNSGQDGVK